MVPIDGHELPHKTMHSEKKSPLDAVKTMRFFMFKHSHPLSKSKMEENHNNDQYKSVWSVKGCMIEGGRDANGPKVLANRNYVKLLMNVNRMESSTLNEYASIYISP